MMESKRARLLPKEEQVYDFLSFRRRDPRGDQYDYKRTAALIERHGGLDVVFPYSYELDDEARTISGGRLQTTETEPLVADESSIQLVRLVLLHGYRPSNLRALKQEDYRRGLDRFLAGEGRRRISHHRRTNAVRNAWLAHKLIGAKMEEERAVIDDDLRPHEIIACSDEILRAAADLHYGTGSDEEFATRCDWIVSRTVERLLEKREEELYALEEMETSTREFVMSRRGRRHELEAGSETADPSSVVW